MTTTPTGAIAEIVPVTVAPVTSMRCARCMAQAYVECQLVSGGRLEWCAHHYEQHQAALDFECVKIIDHRPYLRALEKQARTKDDRR